MLKLPSSRKTNQSGIYQSGKSTLATPHLPALLYAGNTGQWIGDSIRQQALRLIADGINFRRTARLVGANYQTVINWFRAAAAQLQEAP